MSVGCSVTGWSAVDSAMANSTLAGVLAGFMINGIILILGNQPTQMKPGYIRGLSLLFAAFVALGFDSFLFGLVTGDTTNIVNTVSGEVSGCRRAWTEAMLGAGLLAVGTIAIIAGFVYLFTTYLSGLNGNLRDSLNLLEALCNGVRAGVGVAVVAALYLTSRSYLYAIYNGLIPSSGNFLLVEGLFYGASVLAFVIAAVFQNQVAARLRHYRDQLSTASKRNLYFLARYVLILALTAVLDFVSPTSDRDKSLKYLKKGITWSVLYTVISALGAALVAVTRARFWYPIHQSVSWIIIVTVVWVTLIPLIPLYYLLGRAVPPFDIPPAAPPPIDTVSSASPLAGSTGARVREDRILGDQEDGSSE